MKVIDIDDFTTNHIAIEMIKDKNWFFHIDEYGRVHTNVSNLKKELRKCLMVNKKSLNSADIVNSQPLFLAKICTNYLNNLPLSSLLPPIRSDILGKDVKNYIDLVQTGSLYEFLFEKLQGSGSRTDFKRKLFAEVFFGKNYQHNSSSAKLFSSYFPTISSIIWELKSKDYRMLSKLLQKVESSFIFQKVVKTLMNQAPDVFVTTIHDCLLATNVDQVADVMKREFENIGIHPQIKIERYE